MIFFEFEEAHRTIFLMFVMSEKVPRLKDLLQDILPELQLEKKYSTLKNTERRNDAKSIL